MSTFNSELAKKCRFFTLIGLGLGVFFGLLPDSKAATIYGPMYFFIKAVEGIIFGAILGLLFGILNYVYEKSSWLRPILGAMLCFTIGFLLVGIWGFIYEADHAWELRSASRSPESIQIELAFRDGLWGGLIGAGLGLVAGIIDQLVQRKRLRKIDLLKAQSSAQ
jgi:hypothetical protein